MVAIFFLVAVYRGLPTLPLPTFSLKENKLFSRIITVKSLEHTERWEMEGRIIKGTNNTSFLEDITVEVVKAPQGDQMKQKNFCMIFFSHDTPCIYSN